MSDSFHAIELIRLPRMSASEAMALAAALSARAEEMGPLSEAAGTALVRMRVALGRLREVVMDRAEPTGEDTGAAREADRDLDAAWAAAFAWCSGWTKLPYPSNSATRAGELYRALFIEGLKFTQYRYKVEWVESQARLESIDAQGLDQHFAALGGAEILDAIRRAHDRYGQALGITEPREPREPREPGESGQSGKPRRDGVVAERLAELGDELREYVLHVLADVDRDNPASRHRADRLLEPLRGKS